MILLLLELQIQYVRQFQYLTYPAEIELKKERGSPIDILMTPTLKNRDKGTCQPMILKSFKVIKTNFSGTIQVNWGCQALAI